MKIAQIVPSLNQDTGGPAYTVTRLSDELQGLGNEVRVFALDYPSLGPQIRPLSAQMRLWPINPITHKLRGFSPGFFKLLKRELEHSELIHNHGLWMGPGYFARRVANHFQIPLVVSPRGMLEPWARGFSRSKKYFAGLLFENRNLRSARAFHATSESEYQQLRSLGYHQPVALIPNGVDLPDPDQWDSTLIESLLPELKGKQLILFLSRIHPKKGLDMLLESFAQIQHEFPDWHVLVAGSDILGLRERYQSQARRLGIADRVTFHNHLNSEQKFSAFRKAQFLVLPTRSENFGVVVAEALGFERPVITTTETPWHALEQNKCGWVVTPDVDSLTGGLRQAMSLDEADRRQMGRAGRKWIERDFNWAEIGNRMNLFYSWLLGNASQPSWVGID